MFKLARMYISINFLLYYLLFNFGAKIEAIILASNASEGELPFQVSLQVNNTHNCGGSILNQDMVITAKHCVVGKRKEDIRIVAGTTNLETMKNASIHAITEVVKYRDGLYAADDLALIQVNPPFEFDQFRNQVALPAYGYILSKNKKVFISGWGRKNASVSEPSKRLKIADVYTLEQCNPPYAGDICTVHKTLFNRDKGVCKGDSGGPVTLNKRLLVGVIAGAGYIDPLRPNYVICGSKDYPDRHVKVSYYIDWILDEVQKYSNYPLIVVNE